MISEERRRKLDAIAAAHDEWERLYAGHRMDPAKAAARPDGSDYNLHDLDVDPPPDAEEVYHEILARHLAEAEQAPEED